MNDKYNIEIKDLIYGISSFKEEDKSLYNYVVKKKFEDLDSVFKFIEKYILKTNQIYKMDILEKINFYLGFPSEISILDMNGNLDKKVIIQKNFIEKIKDNLKKMDEYIKRYFISDYRLNQKQY